MAGKKQCKKKGCRKKRMAGSEFCADHAQEEAAGGNGVSEVDPEDEVMKLTESELDKFNLLRLRVEKVLQAIRVNELELDKLRREFRDAEYNKEQFIQQQKQSVGPLEQEYMTFAQKLAIKYGFERPQDMGIHDDTGIIQDVRPTKAEPG